MSPVDIGEKARQIVERMTSVDLTQVPVLDRARVEQGFEFHFRLLGLAPQRLEWASDMEAAMRAINAIGPLTVSSNWAPPAYVKACEPGGKRMALEGWHSPIRLASNQASREACRQPNPTAWFAVGDAAEAVLNRAREVVVHTYREEAGDKIGCPIKARIHFVPHNAANAAAWSAAGHNGCAEAADLMAIWLPLVDCYEAGLWGYSILMDRVIALPRPLLRITNGQLHSTTGPAVRWVGGAQYFFYKGVAVEESVIRSPERITLSDIETEADPRIRDVLIDRYGSDRYRREQRTANG
jgi:Domain of unknown function (DUF6745)